MREYTRPKGYTGRTCESRVGWERKGGAARVNAIDSVSDE